jgi:hypothetical protein
MPLLESYPKVTRVIVQRDASSRMFDFSHGFGLLGEYLHRPAPLMWGDEFLAKKFAAFEAIPPISNDPLAAARLRGRQAQRDLLATQGDLLDADEVANRLHADVPYVEQQRAQGQLLAFPTAAGKPGYPSWQFDDDGLLPGLETIFRAFGVRDPWMQAAFFLSGNLRLGGQTPLEVLLRGEVEAVRSAAAAFGEQGAA